MPGVGVLILLVCVLIFLVIILLIEGKSEELNNSFKKDTLIILVSIITFVWVAVTYLLMTNHELAGLIREYFDINLNFKQGMKLNEGGDYLAGFFAPIIFLWLVVGVYIQKKEFQNAVTEYQKSIQVLEKQSTLTDIQNKNTWFHRNIDILEKYIDNTIDKRGPLGELLNRTISKTISQLLDVVDDIKNIVEIDQYVQNKLSNKDHISIQKEETTNLYESATKTLLEEYNIVFAQNIGFSKLLYIKIYLQVYLAFNIIEEKKSSLSEEQLEKLKKEFYGFYEYNYLLSSKRDNIINELIEKDDIKLDIDFIDIMFDKMLEENKIEKFIKDKT